MDHPRGNILKGHGEDVKLLYVKVVMSVAEKPGLKTRDLVELVDTGDAGLGLRSVSVDGSGRLKRMSETGILGFTFEYLGFTFAVRAETSDTSGRLRVHADLGHLPYTAEAPFERANVWAIVSAAARALGGRLQLARTQQILLIEDFYFDEPLTPILLLASTTRLLLEVKPYLELLAVFVKPSGGA